MLDIFGDRKQPRVTRVLMRTSTEEYESGDPLEKYHTKKFGLDSAVHFCEQE